jgi:hypothetical protein
MPPGSSRSYILPPVSQPLGPVAAVWLRKVRAWDRVILIILWTLISMVVQALMLVLPGRGKVVFPKVYWQTFAWLLGSMSR